MNSTVRSPGSSALVFWGLLLFLLLIDQVTKVWAWQTLPEWSSWGDLFRLTYAENPGAFLSLGANFPPSVRFAIMIGFNSLMLIGIAVALLFFTLPTGLRWGWGVVLAGGVGNLIDRLIYDGHVIDFLNVGLGPVRSGIFNFADMYLTGGVLWLCLIQFWSSRSDEDLSGQQELTRSEDVPESAELAAENTAPGIEEAAKSSRAVLPLLLAGLIGVWGSLQIPAVGLADNVVYRPSARGGFAVLNGEILDFTRKQMSFRSKSPDTLHQLSEDQVVSFEAYLTAEHKKAEQALESLDFAEVQKQAEAALRNEQRSWVKRELWALQIQASVNQQEWVSAATTFQMMLKNDRETRHQDLLPLFWRNEELTPTEIEFAVQELSVEQPVSRLLAASWLLEHAAHGQKSQEVLNQLLYSPLPEIRGLARCQLWRIRLKADDFNDGELARWEKQWIDLPEKYRAGPAFLLGMGYERQVKPELAAARYLWLTTMDARQVLLAKAATLKAASLLESIGQALAAERLRDEASRRFTRAVEKSAPAAE